DRAEPRLPLPAVFAGATNDQRAHGVEKFVPSASAGAAAGCSAAPVLQASALTKRYGGIIANDNIDFSVKRGELHGIIGPNGAGKSTLFKMLTCEIAPTSGRIMFDGRDISGMHMTDVSQLGLTKNYQVNQLFAGLT